MHFSIKHTLFLTFGVLTLFQFAIAHPILLPHEECDGVLGSKLCVRSGLESLLDDPGETSYQPGPTRLKLGYKARKELDRLGLHGKARKNTINWHKKQMKKAMRTNPMLNNEDRPAQGGIILHITHKGGSNPREKNHITASFTDEDGQKIKNNFNGKFKHHIYVSSSNKGLPSHVKGAMDGANARINHKSRDHQVSSGKARSRGKSRTKGKGKSNPTRNFSKHPHKGYKQRGGK